MGYCDESWAKHPSDSNLRLQLLKNHHYLLSTLVLWNALSMEALPIFLDKLLNPLLAVVLSVTVVLVFGMLQHS